MKSRNLLALILALSLCCSLLAGCGGSAKDNYMSAAPEAAPEAEAPAAPAPMEDFAEMEEMEYEELTDSAQSAQTTLPENQKLITTVHMDAETEDLDATLAYVDGKIAQLGGYMEAQDIYNGSAYSSYRHRNANLTIRIPADRLNQFVDQVSESANIVSKSTSTENVTLSYISTASRITALETEEETLLEFMAQAETMEDLLTIEARLTDVRTELEQYASQLRLLDNKISYSTIYLFLEEVVEYTEVEQEPETFWERISKGFSKSMKNLGNGILEFIIFLITAFPYFIPVIVIAVIVILIIKLTGRKKKKNTPPPVPPYHPPEKKD